MKRRNFIGFFLIGGLISIVKNKLLMRKTPGLKKASFWRKTA